MKYVYFMWTARRRKNEMSLLINTFLVLTSWTLPGRPHSPCYYNDRPCHSLARPHQQHHRYLLVGLPCTWHFHGMLCYTPGRRRTSTRGIFLDKHIWYLQPASNWKDTSTMTLNRLKLIFVDGSHPVVVPQLSWGVTGPVADNPESGTFRDN